MEILNVNLKQNKAIIKKGITIKETPITPEIQEQINKTQNNQKTEQKNKKTTTKKDKKTTKTKKK